MRQKILPHSKLIKTKRLPTLKSYRRLVIGDKEYRYRIGSGGVRIVTPKGKNVYVDMSTFSGWSWNDIERGLVLVWSQSRHYRHQTHRGY